MNRKILTLCLVQKDGRVLLGMKKRGFGMGKWNGFGGKVDAGETVEEAAKRELFEEAGISVVNIEKMWPDDKFWFPLFLENKKFIGKFIFDEHNQVIGHELKETN